MAAAPTPRWRGTLIKYLRLVATGKAPVGWTFLARDPEVIDGSTECVVQPFGEDGLPVKDPAFPYEGLDDALAADTVEWARSLESPPSDDLLVSSFRYYLVNDAFLPSKTWRHGRAR